MSLSVLSADKSSKSAILLLQGLTCVESDKEFSGVSFRLSESSLSLLSTSLLQRPGLLALEMNLGETSVWILLLDDVSPVDVGESYGSFENWNSA